MKLLIPCCGRSSRFPNLPPKWLLPDHDGRPMLMRSIAKLAYQAKDLVITILKDHEETYSVTSGLKKLLGEEVTVLVLEKSTKSQSETIYKTIEVLKIDEPFLVKDSDNCFHLEPLSRDSNFVAYDSLNNHELINPKNKSYLQIDAHGTITNIREKTVISDTFSVGGYFFKSPATFIKYYQKLSSPELKWHAELYLSDIISAMILDGHVFEGAPVSQYQDWGTIHDWKRFLLETKTYFVALDGFLFERGSDCFKPLYEETKENPEAIKAIVKMRDQGHQIVFLSIRSQADAALTRNQLSQFGLATIPIFFNCPISRWDLITSPIPGLPFRTSAAHELRPDEPGMQERLAEQ